MRLFVICIQFCLLSISFYWLATHIEWHTALRVCNNISVSIICLVLLQRYVPYVCLGLRLSMLFKGRPGFWACFKASLLCVGCNNVLPARMGELVKIAWLQGRTGRNYAELCGNVFLERLLDVTCLLGLSAIFAVGHISITVAALLAGAVVLAWLLIAALMQKPTVLRHIAAMLPLGRFAGNWCAEVAESVCDGIGHGRLYRLVAASVFMWLMNYTHVALLANGLMGLGLNIAQLGLLCVTIFFSSALLLAPGGIGVMEMGVVLVLQLMGIDIVQAFATAIFARIFYSLPVLFGAVLVVLDSRNEFVACIRNIRQWHFEKTPAPSGAE